MQEDAIITDINTSNFEDERQMDMQNLIIYRKINWKKILEITGRPQYENDVFFQCYRAEALIETKEKNQGLLILYSLLRILPTSLEHMYIIGKSYYILEEYTKAVEYFKEAAGKNHPMSLCILGFCYEHGYGVDRDLIKAFTYYKRSALQNYMVGQSNLGSSYYFGIGVDVDKGQAFQWYMKASNQGLSQALHSVGFCYEFGHGTDVNFESALQYYERAGAIGHSGALCNIGIMYERGTGVDANIQQAIIYYRKSSELNNCHGLVNLSRLYYYGLGLTRDEKYSRELAIKAMEIDSVLIKALPLKFQKDKELAMFAMKQNGKELFNLVFHREDPDVALCAIANYPKALAYCSFALQNNYNFLKRAIKVNRNCFQYLQQDFMMDRWIYTYANKMYDKLEPVYHKSHFQDVKFVFLSETTVNNNVNNCSSSQLTPLQKKAAEIMKITIAGVDDKSEIVEDSVYIDNIITNHL